MTETTTHRCPRDGDGGLTTCCGKTPFELPRTDRMTVHDDLVNCAGSYLRTVDLRHRLDVTETALDRLVTAVDSALNSRNRLCNVCIGHSPPWDGHDRNPPCFLGAMEALTETLAEVKEATAE